MKLDTVAERQIDSIREQVLEVAASAKAAPGNRLGHSMIWLAIRDALNEWGHSERGARARKVARGAAP